VADGLNRDFDLEASIAHKITAAVNIIPAIVMTMSEMEKRAANLNTGLDFWNKVYVWGLAVTVLAGFVTFIAQRQSIVGSRKLSDVTKSITDSQNKAFQLQLLEQREKTAKAETATAELRRFMNETRHVDEEKSKAILENRPKGRLIIRYVGKDTETEVFALQLFNLFVASGWQVSKKIKDCDPGVIVMTTLPKDAMFDPSTGKAKNALADQWGGIPEPGKTVHEVLSTSESFVGKVTWAAFVIDEPMPDEPAIVEIGRKF